MLTRLRAVLGDELNRASQELDLLMQNEQILLSSRSRADAGDAVATLQKKVAHLGQLVGGLSTIDEDLISADRAGFGSLVTAKDLASGTTATYTLMAGHLVEIDQGQVSMASPLGRAFVGSKAGTKVNVTTPIGTRRYEILAVTTLGEQFGIEPVRRGPGRKPKVTMEPLPAA